MKTKDIVGLLLTISGIGIAIYFIYKLTRPSNAATANNPNAQTASPWSALYNGWGKLFGGQSQTDNTGALITASGNAIGTLANSLKGFFGTPVASPVSLTPGDLTLVGGGGGGGLDFAGESADQVPD